MKRTIMSIALLLALSATACVGKSGPNLAGKWVPAYNQDSLSFSMWSYVGSLEFLKDGTFILGTDVGYGATSASGKYSFPDDTHVKFQSPTGSNAYGFSLSGSTFTLKDADGSSYEFRRSQ